MIRSLALSALTMTVLAGAANADVLWDQSAINLAAPVSLPNAIATGFNGSTTFGVSDVSVPAGGWTIQSVTTYFGALSWFSGIEQGVLNVFPKSGSLPTAANDPRNSPLGTGTLVTISQTVTDVGGNGVNEFTASGLNIALAPGEYWIGLTPIGPGGFFGADLQWVSSSTIGASQATRGYPDTGWMNTNSLFGSFGVPGVGDVDGAIKIQGIPAPGSLALLGLGGLMAGRRRR